MSVLDVENRKIDSMLGAECPPLPATVDTPSDLAVLRSRWQVLTAVPVLLEARSAGTDHSWAGLDVRTLLRGEQSSGRFAVHSVVLTPGATLPTHYFDETHTYVLVTDGEVELGIGLERALVGQHSLGYAPPRTRQMLSNTSSTPATVMLVHSPAGTDRAFRAAHAYAATTGATEVNDFHDVLRPYGFHFDDAPLDNDSRVNEVLPPVELEIRVPGDLDRLREAFASRPATPQLIATTAEELDATGAGETRRKQLLNGDVSGGAAMINMLSALPGFAAPAHHQPTEEEFFFITRNTLIVTCATETRSVQAGAFAFCPRNCTHGFANDSGDEARFMTLNSPAGHERGIAPVRALLESNAPIEVVEAAASAGGWVLHSLTADPTNAMDPSVPPR